MPSGWVLRASADASTAPKAGVWIYDYPNNPGGISSVSITFATGHLDAQVTEWTCAGVSNVTGPDQTGSATGSSSSSPWDVATSGNLTGNHELAIAGFAAHYSAATATILSSSSGFTGQGGLNQGQSQGAHAVYDVLSDTGASSSGSTLSDDEASSLTGPGNWAAAIVTWALPVASATLPTAQVTTAANALGLEIPQTVNLTVARVTAAAPAPPLSLKRSLPVVQATAAARAPVFSTPGSGALTTASLTVSATPVNPTPTPFPSRLACQGQDLVDEAGNEMPLMLGFCVPVYNAVSTLFPASDYVKMYNKGARVVRMMVYWDQLQPNNPSNPSQLDPPISMTWVTTCLDVAVQRAIAAGLYVWFGFYFGPQGQHMPTWAVTTTDPGNNNALLAPSSMSNYVANGQTATQFLAQRYGDPADPTGAAQYSKAIMGMGINEPTPDNSTANPVTGLNWLTTHVAQQVQMATWMRQYAPAWIMSIGSAFGGGAMYANAPGSGQTAQTFNSAPANPTTNFWVDHHNHFWNTDLTKPQPWDGRDPTGETGKHDLQRQQEITYPPVVNGTTLTSAQLRQMNTAYLANFVAYCDASYANCPLWIGEDVWDPVLSGTSGISQHVADKTAVWYSTAAIVGVTQWDYATDQNNDHDAARPGAGAIGADPNDPDGWQIWTNTWLLGTQSVNLPAIQVTPQAQPLGISAPAEITPPVANAGTIAPHAPTLGVTVALAPAQIAAKPGSPPYIVGTRTPLHLGGTVLDSNQLGGAATLSAPVYSATSVLATKDGTAALTAAYSATLNGWTMTPINLTLAEFNDEALAVSITSGGSALNITGMEVDAFFKTAAGVLDTDPSTIKLTSNAGGGITVTNAANGQVTVNIPASDLANAGIGFWRLDVVSGGLRNTAIYGTVSVTLL